MAREIRITVDDDEVFERMRRRKDDLDLSWEEALRRGLSDPEGSDRGGTGAGVGASAGARPGPRDPEFGDYIREQVQAGLEREHERAGEHRRATGTGRTTEDPTGSTSPRSRGRRDGSEYGGSRTPSPLEPGFGQWISDHVQETVSSALAGASRSLDAEIERLEDAEDATLVFEHLETDRRVPLRVTVRSSAAGFDVTVVAIRTGKGTEELNRFTETDRKEIAAHLADGGTVALEIGTEGVRYDVRPSLGWGRDADGSPTVTDVEIEAVDLA